jgi:hypothetical protein
LLRVSRLLLTLATFDTFSHARSPETHLDPATGQLSEPIAPGIHFARQAGNRSGSMLYCVDPGDAGWRGPVRFVTLDSQAYRIIESRVFATGVLQMSVGMLRGLPSGDVHMGAKVRY